MDESHPIRDHKSVWSLRGHLVLFAMILMLPLVIFSAGVMFYCFRTANWQMEDNARSQSAMLTSSIDEEITAMALMLSTKASCNFNLRDMEDLHRLFVGDFGHADTGIIFRIQSDNTVLTDGSLGTADPIRDISNDFHAHTYNNLTLSISNLLVQNGNYYTQVSVPFDCGDGRTASLSLNVSTDAWEELLRRMTESKDSGAEIFDRDMRLIAHSKERWSGRIEDRFPPRPDGVYRVSSEAFQSEMTVAIKPSNLTGWYHGIIVPTNLFDLTLEQLFWLTAALGVLVLIVSVILAAYFSRKISAPVMQLANIASVFRQQSETPQHLTLNSSISEVNEVSKLLDEATEDLRESYGALQQSEERYRLATEVFQGAIISYDAKDGTVYCSPRFYEMFGYTTAEGKAVDWFNMIRDPKLEVIHPKDRDRVRIHFDRVFNSDSRAEELEYRVKDRHGRYVWVWDRVKVVRGANNKPLRIIGALLDVTNLKEGEKRLRLLVDELNHRVKNTLFVVQSIASGTFKPGQSQEEKLPLFEDRLIALSRAHDLLLQHAWQGTSLRKLAELVLSPFRQEGSHRVILEGEEALVPPQTSVSLIMAFHELATNAVKYGALSNDSGVVHLTWNTEKRMINGVETPVTTCEWREEGGPKVEKRPDRKGFGSRLLRRCMAHDANGEISLEYLPTGVVCRFRWTGYKAEA
jgi:PAS domain S-box-containing protein